MNFMVLAQAYGRIQQRPQDLQSFFSMWEFIILEQLSFYLGIFSSSLVLVHWLVCKLGR